MSRLPIRSTSATANGECADRAGQGSPHLSALKEYLLSCSRSPILSASDVGLSLRLTTVCLPGTESAAATRTALTPATAIPVAIRTRMTNTLASIHDEP